MNNQINTTASKTPWNKGKIVGQKPALKLKELWEIRIRLKWPEIFENWLYSIWQ